MDIATYNAARSIFGQISKNEYDIKLLKDLLICINNSETISIQADDDIVKINIDGFDKNSIVMILEKRIIIFKQEIEDLYKELAAL